MRIIGWKLIKVFTIKRKLRVFMVTKLAPKIKVKMKLINYSKLSCYLLCTSPLLCNIYSNIKYIIYWHGSAWLLLGLCDCSIPFECNTPWKQYLFKCNKLYYNLINNHSDRSCPWDLLVIEWAVYYLVSNLLAVDKCERKYII